MRRKAEASTATLPSHRVDVVEQGGRACRHWVRCEIGENIRFDMEDLTTYCLDDWQARVYDAFVVAAAVQFCDHTKARHSAIWGRDITLRVPVHEPDHWGSPAVSVALHAALSFLTGDQWHISFTPRKMHAPVPRQGHFKMPTNSCLVIPFSDGLDSRVVAGLMEREHGHNLIRVRLGPQALNGRGTGRHKNPFASVPYHVQFGKKDSVESSARSRGFKFTLLGGIAAYLLRAEQVVIPESGQGALGPVLVPVGQAYEDYRNHPLFTNRMTTLLSALFDHKVRYIYPRLWYTKGESLREFITHCPDGANWANTRSCWQGQRQVSVPSGKISVPGKMRQCGVCAACMLRRMSVHMIGGIEDNNTYVWENLSARRFEEGAAPAFNLKKPRGAMYEYAIAGTLHLDHLAEYLQDPANRIVLDRQIFHLSRSLELNENETRAKLNRMLMQHKKEWNNFIESLGPQSFINQWTLGAL